MTRNLDYYMVMQADAYQPVEAVVNVAVGGDVLIKGGQPCAKAAQDADGYDENDFAGCLNIIHVHK